MGKVLLCMGKYAEIPYFMEKAYVNIYSIEELCYCLIQNAYLIEEEIIDKKLINWIEHQCSLPELAEKLNKMLKEECSVSEFVEIILEYAGYGTEEEIARAEENLKNSNGLNIFEKKKTRADYFAENRRYVLALKNYDILIEELPEAERGLKAKVYHNRGVVYAGLFQFGNAAESFKLAFDCDGEEESYIQYLAASRMTMDETEYVDFAAGQTQEYELSLKVEKLMENAVKQFEGTEESRMLFTLKVCKEEDSSVSYYEEIEHITGELKERYREIVAE